MILIITIEDDFSTTQVIRWLNSLGKKSIRINEDNKIVIKELNENDFIFKINDQVISFSEITSIWYRRGNLNIDMDSLLSKKNKIESLVDYNTEEIDEIITYIHNLLMSKKHLNNFNKQQINKLEILRYCKLMDISMPPFIVTQSKEVLMNFLNQNKSGVISKSIKTPFVVISNNLIFKTLSYKLKKEDLMNLADFFVPTFFQKYIPKLYEIRTFYLNGDFYSMSIFSQSNPKTQIDFRNYDLEKPNRETPYKLPIAYRQKITEMMKYFGVNCASLDIIMSPSNFYHLLDINPIGQFGMTSKPCNYNLEKKIAEYL